MAGIKTLGFAVDDHDPRSWELYRFLADMDYKHGDRFCFKAGGDGDNGELILAYLDEWFALAEGAVMDELRPCPFCGGEAELYEDKGGYSVDCGVCGAGIGYFGKGLPDAKGRAVAAWNRRAERTCHIEMPVIDLETGETDYRCSACGFSADPQDWAETYDHCPRCGSRVVTDDADR